MNTPDKGEYAMAWEYCWVDDPKDTFADSRKLDRLLTLHMRRPSNGSNASRGGRNLKSGTPNASHRGDSLPPHTAELLRLFSFGSDGGLDQHCDLWWRSDDGRITFYVSVSDTFLFATADCEKVEPEDMPLLLSCRDDLEATGSRFAEVYTPELFVSRKRGNRPMDAWMQKEVDDPAVVALFEAAGPPMDDPWRTDPWPTPHSGRSTDG